MSKHRKSMLPWIAFVALLVTGALNRQALFSTDTPLPSSPSFSHVSKATWGPCDKAPQAMLKEFFKRHDPNALEWSNVNIWQRMGLEGFTFESDSQLTMGPGQCARLEMKLQTPLGTSKYLVVSDGKSLAKAMSSGNGKPEVVTMQLPPPDQSAARVKELTDQGCGGPWLLVQRVEPFLSKLSVQQSRGKGEKTFKITGETLSQMAGLPLPPGTPVRCHLYLEEKTYWLRRVEWVTGGKVEELVVEMEFRNPMMNQPMNEEECIRQFSFPN